jgi:paraquat-inducible protein B
VKKPVSKTMIGGFVVGAVALIFASIMVFGSGKFFQKRTRYAVYFQESVKGLDVGSSVSFGGVKIGSVSNVVLMSDMDSLSVEIPVTIEIDRGKFILDTDDPKRDRKIRELEEEDPYHFLPVLIEKGLRAQLTPESMVTGKLMIELNFHPDTPVRLLHTDAPYPEIPSIPSTFKKLAEIFDNLPIEKTFNDLAATVEGAKNLVNAPEINEVVHAMKLAMDDVRKLINNVNDHVEPLVTRIDTTLRNYNELAVTTNRQIEPLVLDTRGAVKDYQKLAQNLDSKLDPLEEDASETLRSITAAAQQAEVTLKEVEGLVSDDSVLMTELTYTLKELSASARAIRVWAEYLERHPEALIQGKGGPRR